MTAQDVSGNGAPVRGSEPARLVLVLGGARSGKSRFAQELAETSGRPLVFCATAHDYDDPEMRARIDRHKADRDARWRTVEAPRDLVGALQREAAADAVVLVDCLTLWLGQLMLDGADVEAACRALAGTLPTLPGPVVLVSNEVGFGIVPETPLGRRFRDAQGRLNQQVAAVCDRVVLVVGGLPLQLKPGVMPPLTLG